MITKQIATILQHRQILVNTKGQRCRVNGRCKVWVTRPEDFKLPVKHGLYYCFYITPANAADWSIEETL